jgi:phosphoenolpyruvate carboxylase
MVSRAHVVPLPEQATRSPSPEDAGYPDDAGPVDAAALMAAFDQTLAELRRRTELDPFANPILLLALEMRRRLDAGELTLAAMESLIQRLTVASFLRRSERIGRYLGVHDRAANSERLRQLLDGLTRDRKTGSTAPFETFRSAVERDRFGIVITAHPTFCLAKPLQQALVALALGVDRDGRPLDQHAREALIEHAARTEHRPDQPLDLGEEHRQAVAAIGNLHGALDLVCDLVLQIAEQAWPERWTELNPRLLTVASWVGYDLDGRSDIPWTTTFAKRLRVQVLQLERYRAAAARLRAMVAGSSGLGDILELLEARLALAIKQAADEIAVFERQAAPDDAAWRRQLAEIARTMYEGRRTRLVDASQLIDLLERAIRLSEDGALTRGLCVLRASVRTHGLGLAHTHIRLNARQIHNAIRKSIGMDHAPDDPSHRLSYLNAIAALTDRVEPVRINFGSLLAEKATAKRVFMIVAQMLKYLDSTQPIRFLIAESETGFTLLTALYFAKLFGVEDKVEISPLFETLVGLEQGTRAIAEALSVESFRAYVRRHGRLCVQTGFSDAGRALGQIAAAHAIERLRMAIGRELARQGFADIELVIFDTHGESIGRGGHPQSFADRLDYVDTPASRKLFAKLGVAYKQEVSFQGGDGYLWFATEDVALAATARVLEHVLEPVDEGDDPFYAEADYVHEFFTIVQRFNQRIMDDASYGALLGAYGSNLLYRCGSRPTKRQHDSWSGQISLEHPSQLRAIPHNAVLQQMGFLANSIGGVGQAVAKDPERFQRLYETSPRFRRLMTVVEHAFKFSDLVVLRAYIELFDTGFWLARASGRGESQQAEPLTLLADVMERAGLHERLIRIWRTFTRDYMALASALREHRRRTRQTGAEPIAVDPASRDVMHQLHAARIALIQELYLLAIRVPDFSARHELTHESLIARLIQLDVEAALGDLAAIFPILEQEDDALDFGEPATYAGAEYQSYRQEHTDIFQPIGTLYGLIRRISAAVIHNVGALG